MGLFDIIYRGNVSRRFIKGIYKRSIYITQGTNENHIGSRPKVYDNILRGLYSKAKDLNGNFNGILSINKWINRETKLDIRAVFITLY